MSKKLKIFLIILLLLLFITCSSVVGGYIYLKSKVNKITNEEYKNEIGIEIRN